MVGGHRIEHALPHLGVTGEAAHADGAVEANLDAHLLGQLHDGRVALLEALDELDGAVVRVAPGGAEYMP